MAFPTKNRNAVAAPDIAPDAATLGKGPLLTVADAKALTVTESRNLFRDHINPGQLHFMGLLGFDKVQVSRAEGMFYYDQNDRPILDFFGGFGSLALGHNHPRILAARSKFSDEHRHDIALAFVSQYAAALAENVARIAPGDLDMVFFGTSGSEVMEAALKLAERAAGPERRKILHARNSFHGKTKGVLAVTDGALYRASFSLDTATATVPFGDADALEARLLADRSIGILCLETIQGGGGIVTAPKSYWQRVRELCDRHEVIWIADEVQCGYGRTGKFFAFEHYDVVPDITALAKSFGGGKSAMGAMIARRDTFMEAYGKPEHAMIHAQATFGGMGESCVTAIEALNVMADERLCDNAADVGAYLKSELERLKTAYPTLIKDVRGIGLMVGLEFHDLSRTLPGPMKWGVSKFDDKLKGSLCGFVGAQLLAEHGVLVAFTEYNRNVIRLEPPLICTREHVDMFIAALDAVLSKGVIKIGSDFVAARLKDRVGKNRSARKDASEDA